MPVMVRSNCWIKCLRVVHSGSDKPLEICTAFHVMSLVRARHIPTPSPTLWQTPWQTPWDLNNARFFTWRHSYFPATAPPPPPPCGRHRDKPRGAHLRLTGREQTILHRTQHVKRWLASWRGMIFQNNIFALLIAWEVASCVYVYYLLVFSTGFHLGEITPTRVTPRRKNFQ